MNKCGHHPPQWALRFLKWLCPASLHESIEGDLSQKISNENYTSGSPQPLATFQKNNTKIIEKAAAVVPQVLSQALYKKMFFPSLVSPLFVTIVARAQSNKFTDA
jgi:hypothetical protein